MAESTQLTNNVTSGVAWSVAEKIGSALLQAVVSIVVANAIMPMDMGIMAVLTVFTTLAQVVVDSGFSQTLIRKAAPTAEEYRAIFRFNILSSLILYALLSIASPAIARYYGWPLLATVAPVLFLLLPLNALCVIQNTIMVREFRFAQLSTITFASSLISGIIAITMALTGFGIWSLVGQRVSMMAAKAAMLWWKSNWRPRSAQRASSLREMAPYSLRLMTTDIINSLYNNIAQLFIGNIYSGSVLGYFNQAQKLKDMPVNSTMQSVQSVTFPALSKIGDNDVKFSEGYRRVVMLTAFIMFPIMAGLIATAEDIYTLLLKPRWHPAIPYFRILCIAGFFYPIAVVAYNILKVKSNGSIILRLEIVKKLIMTVILVVTIPRSVTAIAWGLVVAAAVEMILNFVSTLRYTTFSVLQFMRTMLPIVVITALMYALIIVEANYIASWHVALRLIVKILTGILAYTSLAYIARSEAFNEAISIVKGLLNKGKRP
ncbi:MAG: lipopolysaccharide biosynthesis protein [Alistipes sp.]|nr:lipopolysaccharide biosynthesis protein [Alistipes sp.]